jgi:hypothetical protein
MGDPAKESCIPDHKASLMCRCDGRTAAAAHSVFSLLYFDGCSEDDGPDQFQSSVPQWQTLAHIQLFQRSLSSFLAKHLAPSEHEEKHQPGETELCPESGHVRCS